MKKVFIVEDHPIVRKGLRGLIESHGGYKVCGTMDRAEGAVCKIISSDADVVLVDISLPGQDGLQLIDELHSRRACLPILVLSMYDSNVYAERALRAGAMGYIKKQEATERVLEGIEAVLGGNVYINKDVESRIMKTIVGGKCGYAGTPAEALSDRELQVLREIGNGFSSREIADKLYLSVKTIEKYRSRIKQKLHIDTARGLLRYAIEWVNLEST